MENTLQNKPILAILPFDHRSYFEKLLSFTEPLSGDQITEISRYKKLIYQGYEKSLELGVPKESSAILVDDVFSLDILLDAKSKGYNTLQSTEVSGDDHFEFEHGSDWQSWVEKVKPTFIKALVRYNPEDKKALNQQSLAGLKELSIYAHEHDYKFLIEPLVIGSESQLASVNNDKYRYDTELRPKLTAQMIAEMQNAGIEPDIWKIEGMFAAEDYERVVQAAQQGGRDHVGVISLGRNETDEVVETWLRIGATVPGVVGFAVGRTVFLDALMKYKSGEYAEEKTIQEIAERFHHFYKVFTQ
jgi:5-dehydro-2-deoxygluconokinase